MYTYVCVCVRTYLRTYVYTTYVCSQYCMIQYTYVGMYLHTVCSNCMYVCTYLCSYDNSLFGILMTWLTSVVGLCICTQSHPCVVLSIPMYIHTYALNSCIYVCVCTVHTYVCNMYVCILCVCIRMLLFTCIYVCTIHTYM